MARWRLALPGRKAIAHNDFIGFVGTETGFLAVLDAADGKLLQRAIRVQAGVATRVEPVGGALVFGGTDGVLRAVDGRGDERWRVNLGRAVTDDDFVVEGDPGSTRTSGSMVVSQSWLGFISPRPLYLWTDRPFFPAARR